ILEVGLRAAFARLAEPLVQPKVAALGLAHVEVPLRVATARVAIEVVRASERLGDGERILRHEAGAPDADERGQGAARRGDAGRAPGARPQRPDRGRLAASARPHHGARAGEELAFSFARARPDEATLLVEQWLDRPNEVRLVLGIREHLAREHEGNARG